MSNKKTVSELATIIEDSISTDIYDILNKENTYSMESRKNQGFEISEKEKNETRSQVVQGYIIDFLERYTLEDETADSLRDSIWEYADWQVDIYNYDLWKKAEMYSEYIENYIDEFDFDKTRGIIWVFQGWQYLFWHALAYEIVDALENMDFFDEESEEDEAGTNL